MMATARDIPGMAFKNASLVLLARVMGSSGRPVTSAELSGASYTIYRLDAGDPDSETPVAGHSGQALGVGAIIFDVLQVDDLWDVDVVGYNFKHTIDVSSQQAFATAGVFYRVRYELTVVGGGQPIVVRFKVKAV